MNRSLKAIYNLDYDKSGYNSGLINWYNSIVDKTMDELSIVDIFKMARQGILVEVAITRAIELFLQFPFDGEAKDGELISLLIAHDAEIRKNSNRYNDIAKLIDILESNNYEYDWVDEDDKKNFVKNVSILRCLVRN